MKKLYKDYNWLYEQYVIKWLSIHQIAKIAECSASTVVNWVKKHNISPHSQLKLEIDNCFWSKVHKGGSNKCWEWQASKSIYGYGQIQINKKRRPAHTISWELYNGRKIRSGYHIHHICENKCCVNPAHLIEITNGEHKTLHQLGEHNYNAKLTWENVAEIKYLYSTTLFSQRGLAKIFAVTQSVIHNIVNNKSWNKQLQLIRII